MLSSRMGMGRGLAVTYCFIKYPLVALGSCHRMRNHSSITESVPLKAKRIATFC